MENSFGGSVDKKLATTGKLKKIALVAHDNMKETLCAWALKNKPVLTRHTLHATGTTGYKLEETLEEPVYKFVSGPLGGDQQIGAKICEGEIDVLIFFWDPFEPMPHDPDVKALLRIAAAWNIPVACNPASADFIISSMLINNEYEREIPDYDSYMNDRSDT